MNTGATPPMYGWNMIPWKKIQRNVFKLHKRIYRASRRGDSRTVRTLQRLLMKSWSAKLLAVRRVTQDNRGHGVYTMTLVMCSTGSCRANAYEPDVSQ